MNVHDAIRLRRSIRKFKPDAIEPDVLEKLGKALQLAPSAKNNQPWKFIFIQNQKRKEAVASACGNQLWMAKAPVIVASAGFPDLSYDMMGGSRSSVEIDLAIAFDHLSLAAASEGIGSCWIGKFDENEVGHLLGIPAEARIIALMPLGFPASDNAFYPDEKRRKPIKEIITYEHFRKT